MTSGDGGSYLGPEAQARIEIDRMLEASGWVVQSYANVSLGVSRGVAVREFPMAKGHGAADYLLFVDGTPAGVVEAKKKGTPLTGVEWQSKKYVEGVPAAFKPVTRPLPFAYESTGVETRFTNGFDPEPASRRVFSFHRPETLAAWCDAWALDPTSATVRQRLLHHLPPLGTKGLWEAQQTAIRGLDESLQDARPRALIQMATGSGKTFTAANISYRLIKHAEARRVLFLVDRKNLGTQTLGEFQHFETPDDGRKFAELYNVAQLTSNSIAPVNKVAITTIQRLYSILRGDAELPDELEEETGFDVEPSRPVEVAYNPALPIEFFDVIVVDECHRSIYGVWRQVLEYFDAFIVGLTATPGKQTYGFFNQNLVMEYSHDRAVADNVNVDFDVFRIRTAITEGGSSVEAGIVTKFRDRETRAERMEKLDEDFEYAAKELDRGVLAKDQIRTIVRTFRDQLPAMFPDRKRDDVTGRLVNPPKTLVFAKTDSHADDIVQIVREEFAKGNDFAVKITSKSGSHGNKPDDLLASFRNSYNPRIAVTVDMIATGTDVKPIECVLFMRIVKSRNYFEQMKGRGVRVIDPTDLRAVTPDAFSKDRFVIVDAVGATETDLNETVPLERKKGVKLDALLNSIALDTYTEDDVSSLAVRLARLNAKITVADRSRIEEAADLALQDLVYRLIDAVDPDLQFAAAQVATGQDDPPQAEITVAGKVLLAGAVEPLAMNPTLRNVILDVQNSFEQLIDEFSKDTLMEVPGFSKDATDRARSTVDSWAAFIQEHRDDITALQLLYNQPYGTKDLTFAQLRELAQAIDQPPRRWTPDALWSAYKTLDASKVKGGDQRVVTDLVSLVRHALDPTDDLVPFPDLVDERFRGWLAEQATAGRTFTDDQLIWLGRIKDGIASSLRITPGDFDYAPFVEHGGLGAAYAVLGDDINRILDQLNEALVA